MWQHTIHFHRPVRGADFVPTPRWQTQTERRAIRLASELGVGIVLVTAVVFALVLLSPLYSTTADTARNSLLVAVACMSAGWLLGYRLHDHPAPNIGARILWGYTVAFFVGVLVLFVTRLPYSSAVLAVAYVVVCGWFLLTYLLHRRLKTVRLAIVDVGRVPNLALAPDVSWTRLSSPDRYERSMGPVVADLRYDFDDEWLTFLAKCALDDVPVYHSKQIWESLTGRVEIAHLSENTFGSLVPDQTYLRAKTTIDLLLALLVTPIVAVLFVVLLPIMWIVQGRPFFYSQDRIGRGGARFRMYKLRTMVVASCTSGGTPDEERRQILETLPKDSRITPLGRTLRRFRLDELPQIYNILRMEMSWIGPRPEAVPLSLWYREKISFYDYRHIVRPGITGWAQINLGHVTRIDAIELKLQYDFYYIRNVSPWLDLIVMLRTVKIVLLG